MIRTNPKQPNIINLNKFFTASKSRTSFLFGKTAFKTEQYSTLYLKTRQTQFNLFFNWSKSILLFYNIKSLFWLLSWIKLSVEEEKQVQSDGVFSSSLSKIKITQKKMPVNIHCNVVNPVFWTKKHTLKINMCWTFIQNK